MLNLQPRITQVILQLRQQHSHFLPRITPQRSQDTHGNVLHAVEELDEIEGADLLQFLVLRPRACRDREELMLDLGEAGVADPAFQFWPRLGLHADALDTFDDLCAPFIERRARLEDTSVRIPSHFEVLELDPAAGLGVPVVSPKGSVSCRIWDGEERKYHRCDGIRGLPKCLLHQPRPVFN